jgi:3-methylfumaryl-CoA hydratase
MPRFEDIRTGDALPERRRETSVVQQFLYNAALWNAHRIHYDTPWAKDVEGYPELVVAGPLMGDWMTQLALAWAGPAGRLASIEYRNRGAAWVGQPLRVTGRVDAVDGESRRVELDLAVTDEDGTVLTPDRAIVVFDGEAPA